MLNIYCLDYDVLIHCAQVIGGMNNPEKKFDFYTKDCAVVLTTAALKIITKNTAGPLAIIFLM